VSDRLPAPMPELRADAEALASERASATPARLRSRPAHTASETPRHGGATPQRGLREIQAWMMGTITGSNEASDAASVLTAGPRLSALARFDVYVQGYRSRLIDCLRDDYPVLEQVMGEERFEALADAYVTRHPSRLPNLNPFGRHMSAFCGEVTLEGFDELRAFASDLAALEWALVEVLHAPAPQALDLAALQALPIEAWARARLVPSRAVRLLRFSHPVNAIYQACRTTGATPPIPAREETATAVYRRDPSLWRMDLTPAMTRVLSALFEGVPIEGALARMGTDTSGPAELAEAERSVMVWFREWVSSGFFEGVEISESP
jgi:hypothetical protein